VPPLSKTYSVTIALLLLVQHCIGQAISVDPPIRLAQTLPSLYGYPDFVTRVMQYFPIKPLIADHPEGAEARPIVVQIPGNKILVSGWLRFVADPADVARLQTLAPTLMNGSLQVRVGDPKAFAIWCYQDGKLVWDRPLGEGSVESVPFQAALENHGDSQFIKLKIVRLLNLLVPMSPMGATLTIDWKLAEANLAKKLNSNKGMTVEELDAFIGQGIASEWVTVSVLGDEPTAKTAVMEAARYIVREKLEQTLLDPVPVVGGDTSCQTESANGHSTNLSTVSDVTLCFIEKQSVTLTLSHETISLSQVTSLPATVTVAEYITISPGH
jgi:hypothetical protein